MTGVQTCALPISSLGWLLLLNPLFALVLVLYSGLIVATAAGLHRAVQSAAHDPEAGRPWLLAGIAFALVHLALYKYAGAFRSLMPPAFQSGTARILMPLGLSYYTLQSLSYLVALYCRRIRPWPWYEVPLYLAFFPTVSAGPIWRADSMESIAGEGWAADPQLHSPRQPVRPALAFGLLFLGLLKIWWLAATLNDGFVEPVFANPDSFDSFSILLAIYGYTAQLYLNFSGHADLAIGTAMLLGFRLPPNFAAPFFAHNLREFWRRWHISLSTWIRDYVYIPLGGSHAGFRRTQLNVILAMCLSGLWHGSGWCFFLWGLLHGLGLVALNLGDAFFDRRDALAETWPGRALGILCTLSFVAFAFLVFRSENPGRGGRGSGRAAGPCRRTAAAWLRDCGPVAAAGPAQLAAVADAVQGAGLPAGRDAHAALVPAARSFGLFPADCRAFRGAGLYLCHLLIRNRQRAGGQAPGSLSCWP